MIKAHIAAWSLKKDKAKMPNPNALTGGGGAAPKPVQQQYTYSGPNSSHGTPNPAFNPNPALQAKGGSVPAGPSPMDQTNATIALEHARAQMQQEQAARDKAAADAARAAQIAKAQGIQANAYNNAVGYGNTQVGARGFDQGLVDKYGLLNLYNNSINSQRGGIAEDNTNPVYNTNTAFSDALSTAQGTYRNDLKKQLNTFTGDNASYDAFADTADDSILQAILGQNKTDAMTQIDAAHARGQLNDQGYQRALQSMGTAEQAASSDLTNLGGGVLSGYRKQLDSLRNGELDTIGNASFDSPINFDSYNTRWNDTINTLKNSLSGDIYKATAGQKFFDPSTYITGAGALQGYYNPTGGTQQSTSAGTTGGGSANPLLDTFAQQQVDPNAQKPTTQNGVF